MNTRLERDAIGEKEIPSDAYYGIQTLRAIENFPVSGQRERPELIRAYILLKKAAAITNMELGSLDRKRGTAIVKATDEILDGKFADQFPVDLFQAGAGTSFNMNINEVLANIALEILGKEKGDYEYLSPNDHVNQSQSSNDTFPTASHIAILTESNCLITILYNLAHSLEKKGKELSSIPKSGRTHLMDALPVSIGDEFRAYGSAIKRAAERIHEHEIHLLEVAIGGTATGTGVNAHPFYREIVIQKLSELTSFKLIPARDSHEALQSRSQMSAFSGVLGELAQELIRIANDLRLMSSGPTAGLSEIVLPSVQPGSSIMPGKINPVMAECLNMVAFQIIGNNATVSLAAQAGQLEMNVMTPIMTSNILESMSLIKNYLPVFQSRCIQGIIANEEHLRRIAERNPILVTLISPKIGYLEASKLVKEAMETKQPIKNLVISKGILSREEAELLFDLENMSKNRYQNYGKKKHIP